MTHIPIGRFGEAVEIARTVLFREIAWSSVLRGSSSFIVLVATDERSFMIVRTLSQFSNSFVYGPFIGH
jgi:hypothetical protein